MIYNFDDGKLGFDFYSTNPPVFRIVTGERPRHSGISAMATFRKGHGAGLYALFAWGETEAEALEALFSELRLRYGKDELC